MSHKVLVSVHGYAGDSSQIHALLPWYEHHGFPVVIVTPEDSKIKKVGPHICRFAGKRAYTGQLSWDRQIAQMKLLLEYKEFDWFLMNDSDSFMLDPVLPDYLYEYENTIYSNLVDDFRKPGESWEGLPPWPNDYHNGFPLQASQPPYFCSRKVLEKLVSLPHQEACPITPFIDWLLIVLPVLAGVHLKPFRNCASCESVTPLGIGQLSKCVKNGATAIHSVKTRGVADLLNGIYKKRNGIK